MDSVVFNNLHTIHFRCYKSLCRSYIQWKNLSTDSYFDIIFFVQYIYYYSICQGQTF